MSDKKVTIEIGRDGCCPPRMGYQVFISSADESGNGHGYRLCGPKICALGRQEKIASAVLAQRDAREIFGHIRPLLGEEWLRERAEKEETS